MANAFGLTGQMRPIRVTRPNMAQKGMPRWWKVTTGDITIPGIHSVFLAKKDFPGDKALLDQGRDFSECVGSDRYDASKLTKALGKEFGILGIGYKFYSSCRYISSTLDAVAAIITENKLKKENVEQIIVKVQKIAANTMVIYEPEYMIQAQFSIPYVVTMLMLGESTGPNWFRDELLFDPQVRAFQHKVKVIEDPDATKNFFPSYKTPSTVEIIMKDGSHYTKTVIYPKGEPQNPFSKQDHVDKLTNMALWLGLQQKKINEIISAIESFQDIEHISEFTKLLVP
jgi:2-methylcitrate dehydratase PrpD